jgi:hypothetical protein
MCFFISAEYTYLEQKEPISTFKHLSGRKNYFQKLLSSPASNTNVSSRDICVSSPSRVGLFGIK